MKNITKIMSLLMINCIIISVLSVAACATEPTGTTRGITNLTEDDNRDEVVAYASALSNYVETVLAEGSYSPSEESDIGLDKIVSEFGSQYGAQFDIQKMANSITMQTIVIDDNNRVVVDGATIAVICENDVEATPERVEQGAVLLSNARSGGTTSIKKYSFNYYGVLGNVLWTITQEAQFTYTGNSASVVYSNGYYKRGALSLWQVSNWKESKASSIKINNVWTKRVASSGNFHWGVEYQGNGLVIEDRYAAIGVQCTVKGKISKYVV